MEGGGKNSDTGLFGYVAIASVWKNPNLSELFGHPDCPWWGRFGVTHLSHIIEDNTLVPFDTLRHKYGLENKILSFPEISKLVMTCYGRLQLVGADPFQNSHRKWLLSMP